MLPDSDGCLEEVMKHDARTCSRARRRPNTGLACTDAAKHYTAHVTMTKLVRREPIHGVDTMCREKYGYDCRNLLVMGTVKRPNRG